MCFHKSLIEKGIDNLADYYSAEYQDLLAEIYAPMYHENGFDFKAQPILTAGKPNELLMYNWGFIPWWTKTLQSGLQLRVQTLNCISEEMYDKPSFRDSAKEGKRCLIPCSGFFEWKWDNPESKKSDKIPHYIHLQNPLFSIAGLYSEYKDIMGGGITYYTYTVLTTKANSKMEGIHNTKKRQPVIIPRQYEKDWLNPNLSKDDVLALCQPIQSNDMVAYTVGKAVGNSKIDTNNPKALVPVDYSPTTLF